MQKTIEYVKQDTKEGRKGHHTRRTVISKKRTKEEQIQLMENNTSTS